MFWVILPYGLKYVTNDSIFSERLHKLNSHIPVFRHHVAALPRTSSIRVGGIQALATLLNERYNLSGQVDDLEQSILHYTEAIFLPHHCVRLWPNIAQIFFATTRLLLFRAAHTRQPEDVKRPVIYLRYLHGQSPEAFNISPDMVKEKLVYALAVQAG